MANFKTHVSVALTASSLVAAVAVNVGLIGTEQSLWYISLGVVGGMLPDIDADQSRPARLLFMGLALWCASLAWLALENKVSERSQILATLAVFGTIRYLVSYIFQKMTVHRGVFHSLLAGTFFAILLVCVRHYLHHATVLDSWLSGLFLGIGFLVHLCLDELFSVDLTNGRMKKSFGTALKVYGYQNLSGSLLLLLLTGGLLIAAPSSAVLRKACRGGDWSRVIDWVPQLHHVLKAC